MIDIPFIVEFSQTGDFNQYVRELEKARDLMVENQKLAKEFGATSANALKKVLTDYANLNTKLAETQKKLQGSQDTKQIQMLTTELEKLKKTYSELEGQMKKMNEERKKSKSLTDEELRKQIEAQQIANQKKAQIREAIKDQQALDFIMKKEVKTLDDLNKQTSALVRTRNKLDLTTKEGRKEFENLTRQIKVNTDAQKKYDDQIGRSFRKVGDYQSAVRSLGNQLMTLAGVTGGISIFRNAVEDIGDFEQSFADLQSILGSGVTEQQYEDLRKGAIEWGKDSTASARDIVEAYKLIGSAKPELLKNIDLLKQTTEQAILLSDASGLKLPDAATRLTDALNQFNLTGEESARVVNVLAAGAKEGSAEIPDTTDALLKFGIVAKNFNVSFEESVGLIQSFAERGLKGAEAGTALRNVLLKMQAAKVLPKEALSQLRAAGVDIKVISDATIPLKKRIEELSKIQGKAAAITKVFGIENVVAGNILLENRKHAEQFANAVTGTNVAQEQAAKRTDTLQGELQKLANAWQSAILEFSNGGGVLKDVVKFIRENLDTILNVIINVTQAFIAFKTTMFAVNTAFKTKDIVSYILNLKGVRTAMKAATIATKETEAAQLAANRAMKANVIGLVVSGLITLVDQLDLFTSAAEKAAEAQERMDAEFSKGVQFLDEETQKMTERTQKISDEYDIRIKELKKVNGKTEEEIKKLSDQVIQLERDKALAIQQEQVKQRNDLRQFLDDGYQLLVRQEKRAAELAKDADMGNFFAVNDLSELNEQIKVQERFLEESEKRLAQSLKDTEGMRSDAGDAEIEEAKRVNEETEKQRKEREKKVQEEFERRVNLLERERMLRDIDIKTNIQNEEKKNLKLMDSELTFLKDRKSLEALFKKDTVKSQLDVLNQEQAILKQRQENYNKYINAIVEAQNQLDDLEIQAIENSRDREIAEAQKELEVSLGNIKVEGAEKEKLELALIESFLKKRREINAKYDKEDFEKGIDAIERYYKEVELNTLESGESTEEIEKELAQNEVNRLEELITERKAAGEDTIDLELDLARKRREIKNKEAEEDKKLRDETIEYFVDTGKLLTKALEEEVDKRIDVARKELEDQQKNVEFQRQLALEGKENTLLVEEELLAQREKKLLEEQRRQEKVKLLETFFNALSAYAKDDPDSAAAKAAVVTFAAKAIAARFEEGGIINDEVKRQMSEDGGRVQGGIFKGKSHKQGGIKIPMLEFEGEEGIFSKKEMKNLGRKNFHGLKNALKNPVNSDIFEKSSRDTISMVSVKHDVNINLKPLSDKIEELKQEVRNKPTPYFHIDKDGNLITTTTAPGIIKQEIRKFKKRGLNN